MITLNSILDFVLGPCIRRIETDEKSIYLTFDDGPNTYCTPQVLDLLKKYDVKATFFIITNKIDENISVFNRIHNEGHTIGNHSPNHNTSVYFKGKNTLKEWIAHSDAAILTLTGKPAVGFRPPIGIRTPELRALMKELKSKPIMWQHRFYDGIFNFTDSSWKRKIKKIRNGDIILLHDRHEESSTFIQCLENFIKQLLKDGFQLKEIQ